MARTLDLILFGATGFVGRLTAEHLATTAPEGLRIGLAGRSRERLEQVRADLGPRAADWQLIEADSTDPVSLRALAEATGVVVSTVGPYLRYGIPLVQACVEAGTDYADLTGEVLFVREIAERFHDRARETGARIVVSCGFDSVPSDLAVHLLRRAADADDAGGLADTTLRVRTLKGGLSGGTIDSMRLQLRTVQDDPARRRLAGDPFALTGGARGASGQRDVWTPFVDAQTGEWNAPFLMATYNTRLVRRSQALREQGYGERFRYREVTPTGRGARGQLRALGLTAGLGALAAALVTPGVSSLAERLLPAPGEGPSAQARAAGRFRVETTTTTDDGRQYVATVAAHGDPGYAATSVMLGQSALALVESRGKERDDIRDGGVLTPAVAIGDLLTDRLRDQGFTLEAREQSSAQPKPHGSGA
ncbi:saccharopine dehydrogenase family protein [Ornithinimicrobium sp. Y1847]|uniref:saccharopine dehydrogenase family protein n=1 Tax=Ornithinimicrobium sp. Y1847 TaxID=3405419 RepID=UPI003B670C76